MRKKKTAVAIDGPGGAGKSTIARAAAAKLGYRYVDTGAMYRTIGLYVMRAGADPHSADEVVPLLKKIKIDIGYGADGAQTMTLNGESVTGLIRTPEISMYASAVRPYRRSGRSCSILSGTWRKSTASSWTAGT